MNPQNLTKASETTPLVFDIAFNVLARSTDSRIFDIEIQHLLEHASPFIGWDIMCGLLRTVGAT